MTNSTFWCNLDGFYLDDHHLDIDHLDVDYHLDIDHLDLLSIWMASKTSLGPRIPSNIHLDKIISPNGYVVNRSPKSQTMA